MSCEFCTDPDGDPCFPCHGLGPHTHHFDDKGIHTNFEEQKAYPGFTPSKEDPGMGVYWCPHCGDGKPDSATAAEPLHPHNDGLDEYRQPVHVGELDPAQRLALARGELK